MLRPETAEEAIATARKLYISPTKSDQVEYLFEHVRTQVALHVTGNKNRAKKSD